MKKRVMLAAAVIAGFAGVFGICHLGYALSIRDVEFLSEYGMVPEYKLGQPGKIRHIDALRALTELGHYGSSDSDLKEIWYTNDDFAHLDSIPEADKYTILSAYFDKNALLSSDDIKTAEPYKKMTNYEALLYLTRFVGDTYGCTDGPEELYHTDRQKIYDKALEKGITDSADISNADATISYRDFYRLLAKAVNTEFYIGGYGGAETFSYMKSYEKKKDNGTEKKDNGKEKTVKADEPDIQMIDASVTYNDDMSVEWIPQYNGIADENFLSVDWFRLGIYSADGECIDGVGHNAYRPECNSISSREMLMLYTESKKRPAYFEAEYTMKDGSIKKATGKIPAAKITEAGTAPRPGQIKWYRGSNMLTLAEGEFRKGTYYLIHSFEHKYRKKDLNSEGLAVYYSENGGTELDMGKTDFKGIYMPVYEDAHLRAAEVTGSAARGFEIVITPESEEKISS